MLAHLTIAAVSLIASGLTLFSGFGLGTILMPVFALFFPVTVAIPATAVVHLANNLFKVGLVGRRANWDVLVRFAPAAALAAIAGAWLLGLLADWPVLGRYELLGETRELHPVKLAIGLVIALIAVLELSPLRGTGLTAEVPVSRRADLGVLWRPVGQSRRLSLGLLLRAGLDKEAFVATGVIAAVIVDTVRLAVYRLSFYKTSFATLGDDVGGVVVTAITAAFLGAYLGARMLKKVTLRFVQFVVALMMVVIGLGLAAGIL